MKHIAMKYVTVAMLVVVFAGVSAAQVTVNPHVGIDFISTGTFEPDGDQAYATSHTAMTVGAEAAMNNGLQVFGKFSYGFGGELTDYGVALPLDTNTKMTANAGVRYALLSQGGVTIGPVVDYTMSIWKMAEGNDERVHRTGGVGAGVYAAMDAGDVHLSASYIHRLSTTLHLTETGLAAVDETGGGNTMAVSGAYKLSDQVSLTASYAVNNEFVFTEENPLKGAKLSSSGFGLGMRVSF